MKDLMVDLETLATSNDAVIASIGAVYFDPRTGALGAQFYANVSMDSCLELGLKTSEETLRWWDKQTAEARAHLMTPEPRPLKGVLQEFTDWINANGRDPFVWGNGCMFDNVIMSSAYQVCGLRRPWHFRNDRDVRTLVALGNAKGLGPEKVKREGVHHNALHDAIYQTQYVSHIYQALLRNNAKAA